MLRGRRKEPWQARGKARGSGHVRGRRQGPVEWSGAGKEGLGKRGRRVWRLPHPTPS